MFVNHCRDLAKEIAHDLGTPQRLIPALSSGFVVGLLIIVVQLSFATLIFSGPLAGFAPAAPGVALTGVLLFAMQRWNSVFILPGVPRVALAFGENVDRRVAAGMLAIVAGARRSNTRTTVSMTNTTGTRTQATRRPSGFPWLLGTCLWFVAWSAWALPDGFVYLDEAVPQAVGEARYAGSDNFVGTPIDGYRVPRIVLSQPAAQALRQACATLAPFGLGIKVFDGYRPQRAVDHFMRWAADAHDTRTQGVHYPALTKDRLIPDGYIARRSGHSRGSSVDLTLVDLADGSELPMGTPFDFFGPQSWPDYPALAPAVRANRALLQQVMVRSGFRPLKQEWWHFTLEREPWPDRYFDFPIE